MRNLICMGILALFVAFAAPVSAAQSNRTQMSADNVQLTGNEWLASSQEAKAAFLLGVDMAIATEFHIAERTDSRNNEIKGKKKIARVMPSPFARGWMKTFRDTTRPQLISRIDGYLQANPNERSRHIFDIIWYEFIAPQTKNARMAGGNS